MGKEDEGGTLLTGVVRMIDSQSKAKGMGCAWLRLCRLCLARLG